MAEGHMKSNHGLNRADFSLAGKIVTSILIGVFGTILVTLFLTTFIPIYHVVKYIPWIIAFNNLITGYSLLDKTRNLLKYKHISAVCAGVSNVIITSGILVLLSLYFVGEYLFTLQDYILFFIFGGICSELGAILAIKYFKLEK